MSLRGLLLGDHLTGKSSILRGLGCVSGANGSVRYAGPASDWSGAYITEHSQVNAFGNKADKLIKVDCKSFTDEWDLRHIELSALDQHSLWPLKDFLNKQIDQFNADLPTITLDEPLMVRTYDQSPHTPIRSFQLKNPVHVKLDISPYIERKGFTTNKVHRTKLFSENHAAVLRQSKVNKLRTQLKADLGLLQVTVEGKAIGIPVRKLDNPLALAKTVCRREALPFHCTDEIARAISQFKSTSVRPLLENVDSFHRAPGFS